MAENVYIVLQNGEVFQGKRFGADGDALGELVFTTSMTGFVETLTDPAYFGQIVVQTFPTIGNYGIMKDDMESPESFVKAYVVRDFCDTPSNFRMDGDIDSFLKELGVIGVYGVDTRAITAILREQGTMNAKIVSENDKNLDEIKSFVIRDSVKQISTEKTEYLVENAKHTVALLNLGATFSTIDALNARGVSVISLPFDTKAEEILSLGVDALVISNGPGDPTDNPEIVGEAAAVAGKIPVLALGLGHQIFALSQGAKITKLLFGHRGANQPVRDAQTNKIYITSQNHGYSVDAQTVGTNAKITHINVNDNSVEGIIYPEKRAIGVQFIPDFINGCTDSDHIFEAFEALMENK